MKLIFVSGPYRGDIAKNIAMARKHAEYLWKQGHAVICPHLNSAFMDGICQDECFLNGDMEMLRRCDTIYMMPKWWRSEGARAELTEALQLGIQIIYGDEL